jgi:iron complex outermembrane receptor protein
MVPGMYVYQIDANKWAVSPRGFASKLSNKTLVMIDEIDRSGNLRIH